MKSTGTRRTTHPAKKVRQDAAKERKAVRNKRTPKQQIEILDQKLGKSQGAKKERSKLEKMAETLVGPIVDQVLSSVITNLTNGNLNNFNQDSQGSEDFIEEKTSSKKKSKKITKKR